MDTEASNGLLQPTISITVEKIALVDERMQTESDKCFKWCIVMEYTLTVSSMRMRIAYRFLSDFNKVVFNS